MKIDLTDTNAGQATYDVDYSTGSGSVSAGSFAAGSTSKTVTGLTAGLATSSRSPRARTPCRPLLRPASPLPHRRPRLPPLLPTTPRSTTPSPASPEIRSTQSTVVRAPTPVNANIARMSSVHGSGRTALNFLSGNQGMTIDSPPAAFTTAPTQRWRRGSIPTRRFWSLHHHGRGKGGNNGFWFGIQAGKLNFTAFGVADTTSGVSVPTNTWSHVALTISGSTVTYYLNGVAVKTVSVARQITATTTPAYIGALPDQVYGTSAWLGGLSDLAIYPGTLSATQIKAHYDAR